MNNSDWVFVEKRDKKNKKSLTTKLWKLSDLSKNKRSKEKKRRSILKTSDDHEKTNSSSEDEELVNSYLWNRCSESRDEEKQKWVEIKARWEADGRERKRGMEKIDDLLTSLTPFRPIPL